MKYIEFIKESTPLFLFMESKGDPQINRCECCGSINAVSPTHETYSCGYEASLALLISICKSLGHNEK